MRDTRERILQTALELFARDGYEAVSVSAIAGALGMTKGALYRHYASKRDIFSSILRRMEEQDARRAGEYRMPEGSLLEMEEAYRSASIKSICAYAKAQLRYWTEDPFAACFRKMLTLEQYRDPEMRRLYQQYLGSGPLGYMTDLFSALGLAEPEQAALRFYGPMYLLYGVYDGAEDRAAALALADACLDGAERALTEEQKMR